MSYKVRVEWVSSTSEDDPSSTSGSMPAIVELAQSETVTGSGTTPVTTVGTAPRNCLARLTVISGAVEVSPGAGAAPTEITGVRIAPEQGPVFFAVNGGDTIHFAEASDGPLLTGVVALETGGNLAAIATVQGTKADAAATDSTSSWSIPALLKGIWAKLAGTLAVSGPANAAATSEPLTGTISDTTAHVLGPFTPQLARDVWATIVGNGSAIGTAQLLRSTDGGTTKNGLTAGGQPWASWTIAAAMPVVVNEQVATPSDAAATFYLAITLSAGSVTYRIAQ